MFRLISIILLICCSLFLHGCLDPNVAPEMTSVGDTKALAMGANIRLVTERLRLVGDHFLPTLCTEPSPDVAVAFGRTLALQASVTEPNSITGSGSLNAQSTELATALAGRTAGVLALRDGLYAACQSYVNGVIGQDAYALILSQYGNLLIALAGTGQSSSPTISSQEAAVAALLVACVSEYDTTRLGLETSKLLTQRRCSTLLDSIISGRLLKAPAVAPKKVAAAIKSPSKGPITETVVETKTTYGPPPQPAKVGN